jgi:hypothetical protein
MINTYENILTSNSQTDREKVLLSRINELEKALEDIIDPCYIRSDDAFEDLAFRDHKRKCIAEEAFKRRS